MKLKNIRQNTKDFQNLTEKSLIGKPEQVLFYLSKSILTIQQYKAIYDLFLNSYYQNKFKLYNELNQQINIYTYSVGILSNIVSKSNLNIDKYNSSNFIFQTNSTPLMKKYISLVPDNIIFATTIPYEIIMGNYVGIIDWIIDTNSYIFQSHQSVSNQIMKKYDYDDNNKFKILLEVIQPPKEMVRYANKNIKGWEILHAPVDILNYYVGSKEETLEILISKNLSTYGISGNSSWRISQNQYQGINPFHIYPSVRNYQYKALLNNYYNINRIVSVQDQNNSSLIQGFKKYINENYTQSGLYYDSSGNYSQYLSYLTWGQNIQKSKYLKSDYSDNNMKNLGINEFKLSDKIGYYNSLIAEQDFTYRQKYNGNQDVFNFGAQFEYLKSNWTFDSNQYTNIASICYFEQINDNNYGFLHQMGKYQIKFDIKIKTKFSNYHAASKKYDNGVNQLITNYQILEEQNNINFMNSNRVLVRIFPINGIKDYITLINNEDIGILLKQQMFKYNYNSKQYINMQNIYINKFVHQQISSFFKPASYYYTLSNVDIYNDIQNRINLGINSLNNYYGTRKMLKPNNYYSDFNFMYNRYGQFLTYRTLNKRYYNYNNKRYADIFGQSVQTFTPIVGEEGWFKVNTQINKNFQGNSIFSIMINQSLDRLVTQHKSQITKIEIKNLSILLVQ